jgi:GAF domain-containing protein
MTDPSTPAADPVGPGADVAAPATSAELGWALNQMTGLVLSRETVETALQLVTKLADEATAGTMGAAVTIVDDYGKRSLAASNGAVERADALQYELDEGPCLTAWRTQEVVRIDDTTTDDRWPRWNKAASELGIRSVLSAPMLSTGDSIGAMKVYCGRSSCYGAHDEHVMRLLAAQAAILLANTQSLQQARRLSRQLTTALTGRDSIARATGVLLARGAVSEQAAFLALTSAARESGRPVEDTARSLLAALAARNRDAADS